LLGFPFPPPEKSQGDAVPALREEDMFEEIRLSGTHAQSFKNQEGLNSSYRGAMTYDYRYKKYYVLMLAHPSRYVAIVSDLHRYGEHFGDKPLTKGSSTDFTTFKGFTASCLTLL
jgi:hypothetical protein